MRPRRISRFNAPKRLRYMHKLAVAALLLLAAFPSRADECNPNWSYSGTTGPQHWGDLGYALCATGLRQSPIEFRNLGRADNGLPTPGLNRGQESAFKVERRAYDVEVKDVNPAWTLQWAGRKATLAQFHFHVRAEHYLNGRQNEGEIHFLFQEDGKNDKIVVAVWLKKGTNANQALQKIIDLKPNTCPRVNNSGAIRIKMDDLLRNVDVNHYATYEGSLTTPTPTCQENVTFIMLLEPLEATEAQINALKVVMTPTGNVRPLQVQGVRWRR